MAALEALLLLDDFLRALKVCSVGLIRQRQRNCPVFVSQQVVCKAEARVPNGDADSQKQHSYERGRIVCLQSDRRLLTVHQCRVAKEQHHNLGDYKLVF